VWQSPFISTKLICDTESVAKEDTKQQHVPSLYTISDHEFLENAACIGWCRRHVNLEVAVKIDNE
jgi:hypothetical protein